MSRLGAIRAEIKGLEEQARQAGERIRELKLEAGEIVLAGDSGEPKAAGKPKAPPTSESPTDVKVLEFLKTHGESGAADVAVGIGAAESTVRQSLGKLWKLHRVEKPGQGRYTFKA